MQTVLLLFLGLMVNSVVHFCGNNKQFVEIINKPINLILELIMSAGYE